MRNRVLIIWILFVGVFGILNTEMGVVGLLPYVSENFQVTIVTAGMLISMFALGVAIAGPTMPLIFSRLPKKPVMILVLTIFTISNVASMFVTDFDTLLLLRVIPSFFHPVYCAMAFTVAAQIADDPHDAPRNVAKVNMGVAGGMVIGVPISNFIAEHLGFVASMGFFAIVTAAALILTIIFFPNLESGKPLSYGDQIGVLKRPMVWASIFAVIFLNGTFFGVFNYLTEYLLKVTNLDSSLVSIFLFIFGACNILGSFLAGGFLSKFPLPTVKILPIATLGIYLAMFIGGSSSAIPMAVLTIIFGIFAGINANVNQFWLSHAASEAPDFANGLFLTAANLGTMAATAWSGIFIDNFGIDFLLAGGMTFGIAATIILWMQCARGFRKYI